MIRRLSLLLVATTCWLSAQTPSWVERSNEESQALVEVLGQFQPEMLTFLGLGDYHDQIIDLGPDRGARLRSAVMTVREHYRRRLEAEENPFVREDLAILIDAADENVETSLIQEQHMVPYVNASQLIYQGLFGLLKPDAAPEHRPAALSRLERYLSLPAQVRARYAEAASDPELTHPFRSQLEQGLANTPRFIAGIRALFAAPDFDAEAVNPLLDQLETELTAHDAWVRETVLPAARTDSRLPAPVYAQNLRGVGLDIPPAELIERAQTAYAEIRNEMRTLAGLIAAERGWDTTDYTEVIRRLKAEQIPADNVIPTYEAVIAEIEDIIRRERIVTLPDRPMAIRLATEAENAAQPAPHMQPPPLTGGTGEERGTFVLTTGTPPLDGEEAVTFDDFTFNAATWTLTAHEGRPGHELQFAAMVERGVSVARSFFAFNSVNVEGWALYAEAELKPYEPLEGQMIALQFRLLRASRAFLDPMLNLGQITREEAGRILREEVVLSDAMTEQELDRYTFRSPGQATAYFYGYLRVMALRTRTELALGDRFDRLAFNDFLIQQGLIPPALLARAVEQEFIPTHREP
ncbi:DUF885 domain-containing protein [Actomonas aquatica]|uniref:DUF885 domain-containing protein n=1 Tax=Actomonas aquatica TaxID=2866162 RepID=A0ABZ1C6E3_9BACT|nr:DUF885 domain-containing protein [Opitutus sp. WL0086]WRQ87220.1 DUF885 domain-containing protein [Opitutus sp. WL0086]